jgi:hypothetical protein
MALCFILTEIWTTYYNINSFQRKKETKRERETEREREKQREREKEKQTENQGNMTEIFFFLPLWNNPISNKK